MASDMRVKGGEDGGGGEGGNGGGRGGGFEGGGDGGEGELGDGGGAPGKGRNGARDGSGCRSGGGGGMEIMEPQAEKPHMRTCGKWFEAGGLRDDGGKVEGGCGRAGGGMGFGGGRAVVGQLISSAVLRMHRCPSVGWSMHIQRVVDSTQPPGPHLPSWPYELQGCDERSSHQQLTRRSGLAGLE